MRVIVEVQGGSQAGRKIALRSGQVMQIGRAQSADLAFPEDSFMSGLHCVLQCGVRTVMICDHDSSNGVAVNGSKVKSKALKNGDEISAGRTVFSVRFLESDNAADFEDVSLEGRSVLSVLRCEFQPLYAIVDAARDRAILKLLREASPEYQSLYEGAQGEELKEVAPYLVRLPGDSPVLKSLVSQGCGKSWGVYLTCDLPLKELREHLRRFLKKKLPNGENVFFRYYDPRVLRIFLPTYRGVSATEFFGPVESYLVEEETAGVFGRFLLSEKTVNKAKLRLKLT
jgi:hypothetical protein